MADGGRQGAPGGRRGGTRGESRGGTRGGTREGGSLSRDRVLDAAMEILTTRGVDRLTVRELAGSLGVAVTAVYWHVGDKQALMDGLADRIIEQFGDVRVRGRDPRTRLLSLGRSLRRSLLEQPDLVAVVHGQGRTAALFRPARQLLVRELLAAGLDGRSAALAMRAIVNLVVGSVLIERQVARQPAQAEDPVDVWATQELPDGAALATLLAQTADEDAVFSYSLQALVGAVLAGVPGDEPAPAAGGQE